MLIGIADEHLRPNEAAWQALFGNEKVYFENFPTAEAVEAYLEDNSLTVLFLRHDMRDVERILTLLQYLEAEKGSSAHAQIITICVVAPTRAAAQRLMVRLDAIGLYRVEYLPLVREMFTCEPAGSIHRWTEAVPVPFIADTPHDYEIDVELWGVPRPGTGQSTPGMPGTDYLYGEIVDQWIVPGCGPGQRPDPLIFNGEDWPGHQDSSPH
jgi:hypothetical protein